MKQAHVFVAGYVQGVGFRQFVRNAARKHAITGWVRNIPDSRVEAVMQGEQKAIESVIEECRRGSFLSEVKELHVVWEEVEEEDKDFTIR